jgi:hypothetical protein
LFMGEGDFLKRSAESSFCQNYVVGVTTCSLSTNSELLLETAGDTFQQAKLPPDQIDFSMRFWVDIVDQAQSPWPRPYARGLGHLVFAGFDSRSSFLADLRTRRVIGRFSSAMAGDSGYWKTIIFPMLFSIMAGSVGLVELHASCLARGDLGIILAGSSRAGKSTLAMALSRTGFGLISDDRVFCSQSAGQVMAWGLPRPLKLRPDAVTWFEELRGQEPRNIQNGERVFHCHPKQHRVAKCEPRLIIFLERSENRESERTSFEMIPMESSEARARLEADLLTETSKAREDQKKSLKGLSRLPCFLLRYAGHPQRIAERLAESFAELCNLPRDRKSRA